MPLLTSFLSVGADAQELRETVARSSDAVFEAFNTCSLDRFAALLAEDIEFYHDKTGLQDHKSVVESVRTNICGKVRRELVSGSQEIYPIPAHGAFEVGVHRFYEVATGRPDKLVGIAKYAHVWRIANGQWKLSRVVSYDHKAASSP